MKIYADTSVYGGAFDDEFDLASAYFFDGVRAGRYALVDSSVVEGEIENAPAHVRALYLEISERARMFKSTNESLALRDAYLARGIVTM